MKPWRHGRVAFVVACLASVTLAQAQVVLTGEAHLHTRTEVRLGHAAAGSLLRGSGDASLADLNATVRPLFRGEAGSVRWIAEIEMVAIVGDTLERLAGLDASLPDRDLVDLSRVASTGSRHRHGVRVDRLALVFSPRWGTVTVGRHAVTWGGGLFFNPFDLFNPFAPADVVRDFKTGADMMHIDVPVAGGGVQALAVGRRDLLSGDASTKASSFALQINRRAGALDWTMMAAWHYDEPVIGAGVGGALGGATWRVDGTWVRVQPEFPGFAAEDYVSAVANMQFAWQWFGRNTYGVAEYFFNGLGSRAYATARLRPVVATQFARGNAFVLGRHYGAASVQMEWHPLLTLAASVIVNLADGSALLQPRTVWDASATLRVTAGLDLPVGGRGTEFGGYALPGLAVTTRSASTAYVIATWEF